MNFKQMFLITKPLSQSCLYGITFTSNFKSLIADPKVKKDILIFPTSGQAQPVSWFNEPQHDVIRDDFNVSLPKPIIQTFSEDFLDF